LIIGESATYLIHLLPPSFTYIYSILENKSKGVKLQKWVKGKEDKSNERQEEEGREQRMKERAESISI